MVAKVEWRQDELFPRGFIVTNLARPPARVVKFYNGRGTAEQHIKEGKNAFRRTRLSCHRLPGTTPCGSNSTRLPRQLHARLGTARGGRALVADHPAREAPIKIGARIVRDGRYLVFQLAEVTVPRALFAEILCRIDDLRLRAPPLAA